MDPARTLCGLIPVRSPAGATSDEADVTSLAPNRPLEAWAGSASSLHLHDGTTTTHRTRQEQRVSRPTGPLRLGRGVLVCCSCMGPLWSHNGPRIGPTNLGVRPGRQHHTPQYGTAQHSTPQHSIAWHSTAWRGTAQHSTAWRRTAQHRAAMLDETRQSTNSSAKHDTAQHGTARHITAHHITFFDILDQRLQGQRATNMHAHTRWHHTHDSASDAQGAVRRR